MVLRRAIKNRGALDDNYCAVAEAGRLVALTSNGSDNSAARGELSRRAAARSPSRPTARHDM